MLLETIGDIRFAETLEMNSQRIANALEKQNELLEALLMSLKEGIDNDKQ